MKARTGSVHIFCGWLQKCPGEIFAGLVSYSEVCNAKMNANHLYARIGSKPEVGIMININTFHLYLTRPNFSLPSSRFAVVYQLFCSRTIANRL